MSEKQKRNIIEAARDIGLMLKLERVAKRLKQGDVARMAGISFQRLSGIENGKVIPEDAEVLTIKRVIEIQGSNNGVTK